MDYLEFVARMTSPIPDKGEVMVRYYGLCANAHRGKGRKAVVSPQTLLMNKEEIKPVPPSGFRNGHSAGCFGSGQFSCS